jgi:hypothetical protein
MKTIAPAEDVARIVDRIATAARNGADGFGALADQAADELGIPTDSTARSDALIVLTVVDYGFKSTTDGRARAAEAAARMVRAGYLDTIR